MATLGSMEPDLPTVSQFVKEQRKRNGLTQADLARMAGVGYRFVRELESGKKTLRLDKVNQVLMMFGCELGVVRHNDA